MIASPANVTKIGIGLDHPESLCIDQHGVIYAGGEAGQIYRISPDGDQQQIATTGGFILGLVLDGRGRVHACDAGKQAVFCISSDGTVTERSKGTAERPMQVPNHPIFDDEGNLYVSDSGDYWDETGTGCVYRIRPDNTTELFHAGPFRFANGITIDPSGQWLYIGQSAAWNIVRIPLDQPNGPIEVTHTLPDHTIPDGMVFSSDGRLVVGCYRPDQVVVCHPDGCVEVLIEDLTAELLLRPTNVALYGGRLYTANLGGWHISAIDTDMEPGPVRRPSLS